VSEWLPIILSKVVDGKTVNCDGKCHGAKNPKCECICGGKYHGISKDMPNPETLEEAEKLVRNRGGKLR
jgi:hypothetical protein